MKAILVSLIALTAVTAAACGDGSLDTTGVDLEPTAAMAGAAKVTNGNDAGPGSLRQAIETANANPGVNVIQLDNGIGTIELQTSLVYTGTQPLRINGRGAAIDGPDNGNGFTANGGGNLTLRDLTFQNAYGNGVFVEVPAGSAGMLKVSLENVTLQDNGLHGLHIDDQVDDVNDTGSDSDAGIQLSMASSIVDGNGFRPDISDYDGVRVDEGGMGDLVVTVHKSYSGATTAMASRSTSVVRATSMPTFSTRTSTTTAISRRIQTTSRTASTSTKARRAASTRAWCT
jgi:hypothetical protein